MQKNGIDPYFITNNSSMTHVQLWDKLASFGITADLERIMTSAIAAAKYCKDNYNGASVMMIGEKGLEEAFVSEGIEIQQRIPMLSLWGLTGVLRMQNWRMLV